MTVSVHEQVMGARQRRPAQPSIDILKLIVCIGGGVLPWAAILGAVRLMLSVLG